MQLVVIHVINVAEREKQNFIQQANTEAYARTDLQFEFFMPLGTKSVWLDGSGFNDFCRHWAH